MKRFLLCLFALSGCFICGISTAAALSTHSGPETLFFMPLTMVAILAFIYSLPQCSQRS